VGSWQYILNLKIFFELRGKLFTATLKETTKGGDFYAHFFGDFFPAFSGKGC
jgi:hypothetical protein